MSREDDTAPNDFTSAETHENNPFQAEVLAMLAEMKSGMHSMSSRISELEHGKTQSVLPTSHTPKGKGKAPRSHSTDASPAAETSCDDNPRDEDDRETVATTDPTRRSKHWADRDDEVMDYEAELVWDNEYEETPDSKGITLFKVGEKTEKFLAAAFSSAASNTTRRQWRATNTVPPIL